MALDPGFRLDDAQWNNVLAIWNAEASDRGINPADFGSMLQVLQDAWGLLIDEPLRDQLGLHQQHQDLLDQLASAQAGIDAIQAAIDALDPDPGPPVPRT